MECKPEMKASRQEAARQCVAAAQIVTASKEGRHVFYQINAGSVAERLEGILTITRLLESATGADSATAMKAKGPSPREPIVKGRSHAG